MQAGAQHARPIPCGRQARLGCPRRACRIDGGLTTISNMHNLCITVLVSLPTWFYGRGAASAARSKRGRENTMRSPRARLGAALLPLLTAVALLAWSPAAPAAPAAAAVSVPCGGTQCPAPTPNPGWQPTARDAGGNPLNLRWQYQLQGARTSSGACDASQNPGGINVTITGTSFTGTTGVSPVVFDVDHQIDQACDTSPPQFTQNTLAVQQLHARGAKVIGYVDAGTWEAFRADAAQFDSFNASCGGCLYGRTLSGFHDEKWLNVAPGASGVNPSTGQPEDRQAFILDQMRARVAEVKADGFDAVEFDNVDAWQNNTGLHLTADQQLVYDSNLANIAHAAALSVGFKNDTDQIADSAGGLYQSFLTADKAVFQVEYKLSTGKFCPSSNAADRNGILKTFDLFDLPWTPCR